MNRSSASADDRIKQIAEGQAVSAISEGSKIIPAHNRVKIRGNRKGAG
jgi:hypothetical protein